MAKKKTKKKIKVLNLYPEDFDRSPIWEDVCEVLGVSASSDGVSIVFTKVEEVK